VTSGLPHETKERALSVRDGVRCVDTRSHPISVVRQTAMPSPPLLASQFIRIRASLEATDVVTVLEGNVFVVAPGIPPFRLSEEALATVTLCNTARAVPSADGPIILARESLFFWPKNSSKENDPVEVFWVDPANELFANPTKSKRHSEVFARNERRLQRSGTFTRLAELTQVDVARSRTVTERHHVFTTSTFDSSTTSVAAHIEETRMFPLTPAFRRAFDIPDPGQGSSVLLRMTGTKLENGYSDVPSYVQTQIDRNRPEFAFAPTTFFTPNAFPQL
jgi:hypothetical protein